MAQTWLHAHSISRSNNCVHEATPSNGLVFAFKRTNRQPVSMPFYRGSFADLNEKHRKKFEGSFIILTRHLVFDFVTSTCGGAPVIFSTVFCVTGSIVGVLSPASA